MFFPTRLIEVGDLDGGRELKVICTREARPNGPYLTLSHCWGSANFIKLTASTLAYLTKGFPVSILPTTFRDAVLVAQRLCIRYLWVDSLCILQDSVEDWRREAGLMADVYRNTLCNIAATASSDSEGGCFVDRCPHLIQSCIVDVEGLGLPKRCVLYDYDLWKTAVSDAPLNQRAWAMQERLLAPRILHFGKEQLLWECHELDACETYPFGMPLGWYWRFKKFGLLDPSVKGKRLQTMSGGQSEPAPDRYQEWQHVLESYRSCHLTKAEDKLIAISGLAKDIQQILDDEYLAGLWKRFLPSELMWQVDGCTQSNGSPSSRPKLYRAPSWSWASVDGAGGAVGITDKGILITIIEAHVIPATDDRTGQITDGYIRLQGYLTRVQARRICPNQKVRVVVDQKNFGTHFWIYPDLRLHTLSAQIYCLPVRGMLTKGKLWLFGLVLQRTESAKGQCKRFGTFSTWGRACWKAFHLPPNIEELIEKTDGDGDESDSRLDTNWHEGSEHEEDDGDGDNELDEIEDKLGDDEDPHHGHGYGFDKDVDGLYEDENEHIIKLV